MTDNVYLDPDTVAAILRRHGLAPAQMDHVHYYDLSPDGRARCSCGASGTVILPAHGFRVQGGAGFRYGRGGEGE